jgi:hypothetical protein
MMIRYGVWRMPCYDLKTHENETERYLREIVTLFVLPTKLHVMLDMETPRGIKLTVLCPFP